MGIQLNLSMKDVLNSEDAVGEITLKYAWNKDKILLVPQKLFYNHAGQRRRLNIILTNMCRKKLRRQ